MQATPRPPISLGELLQGVFFSITTYVVGLGLFAVSVQAQNTQSKQTQTIAAKPRALQPGSSASIDREAIRPFRVELKEEALVDLRRRIAATNWPERELVDVALRASSLQLQNLANYWANDYDWRKVEARLTALRQFLTTINGLNELIYYNRLPKGGHFAVWQPQLFAEEIRPAFRSLR